jgi:hypothetical protein
MDAKILHVLIILLCCRHVHHLPAPTLPTSVSRTNPKPLLSHASHAIPCRLHVPSAAALSLEVHLN